MKRTRAITPVSRRKRLLLLIAAASVLLAAIGARHCSGRDLPSLEPTVALDRSQGSDSSNDKASSVSPSLPVDGEVYRTADRLREASALALAAALYVANESTARGFSQSADALIAGVRSAGLLPPGITIDGRAMLLSDRSKLLLRFRPNPFAIEVISFPHSREDGPPLMIRIPALGSDPNRGSVFIADRLGQIDPPAPFAALVDCVRAGWIDQPFDQAEIPAAEQQQLRAWLAAKHHQ
jgi:hypothetical protein